MSRSWRGWVELGLPAGVSVVFAAGVGILTNVVTEGWSWTLVAILVVLTLAASAFEVWQARIRTSLAVAGRTDAEAAVKDAEELATHTTRRLIFAIDDVLNPLVELIDEIGDTALPYATRTEYRGAAKERVLVGLERLIKPDGRIRTSYYTVDQGRRTLRIWTSQGRSGRLPARFGEDRAVGRALFKVLDKGDVRLVERGHDPEFSEIAPESPVVVLAPVRSRGQTVGLLVVDVPSQSELTDENMYFVDLFAKLLGLIAAGDDSRRQEIDE